MIRVKIKLQPSSKNDRKLNNSFINLPIYPFNGLLININNMRLKVVNVLVDVEYTEVNINKTELIILCE